jgi:hypothetical protein
MSWVALIYSLHLTGLGYQTGLTPWWHWVKRQPAAPRRFEPRGAYRLIRHPVYLSFLGLIWLTPVVTLDRAILIVVWTLYIAVGSCLKDRRLTHYLGDSYRQYQSRVWGYPGLWFGPLGRVAVEPGISPESRLPQQTPRSRRLPTARAFAAWGVAWLRQGKWLLGSAGATKSSSSTGWPKADKHL